MTLNDPTLLRTKALVGGEWIDADSGETFDVIDPADGSVVASVATSVSPRRSAGDRRRRDCTEGVGQRTAKDRGVDPAALVRACSSSTRKTWLAS